MRANIHHSPKKMRRVSSLVNGMTAEEAIRQLSFLSYLGAAECREVIEEAVEMAVRDHGVEFRTNLWVAESFCVQSDIIKGIRRHRYGKLGEVRN